MKTWVKIPIVVFHSATQFDQTVRSAGFDDTVLIQIPRAEILAGIPREVTLAQRVALVFVRAVEIGLVMAGGSTRVTMIVYVSVVTPSCAVTTVETVLLPMFNVMAPETCPLMTGVPLTVIVAFAW